MKVLFTGITGLLGRYFITRKLEGYEVFGVYNSNSLEPEKNLFRADITDKSEISEILKRINPQVIVHAASIGSVDYCETHKDEAYKVNVEGTKNIVDSCLKLGSKMIFTSSNAVYDGNNPPYNEESDLNPLDIYGKTKVEGEKLIEKSGISYNILRLMTMYGWPQKGGRANPVTWIIEELGSKRPIKVVDDIYNNHLYAGQAADTIWQIIDKRKEKKTYNIAGEECISRYDLALKVAKVFKLDASLIKPVPNSYFNNIAPRPKNTCFNIQKMKKELGINPLSLEEGLIKMADEK